MFNARLIFSLGRDRLLPQAANRLMAKVHQPSGAPRAATLAVGAFSAVCCLLDSHTLLVFLTGLLVYGWSLVCLAVLVGRLKGLTGGPGYWRSPLFPLAPVVGLAMAVVFAVADLADKDAGRPSLLLLGAVVLAAAGWSRFGLRRRGWRPQLGETAL
jgi:amino acid transporter